MCLADGHAYDAPDLGPFLYQCASAHQGALKFGHDKHVTWREIMMQDVVQIRVEALVDKAEMFTETAENEGTGGRLVTRDERPDVDLFSAEHKK